MDKLKYVDKEIAGLIKLERERQRSTLSLIASENYASQASLEAQGSIVANKHCGGYIGARGAGGCRYVDQIEELAIRRAKKLFGAEHVNVQATTASIANLAVYLAMLKPGDTILGLNNEHGGHKTHGFPTNLSGKMYRSAFYDLDPATERLNYENIRKQALSVRPRMIIAGYTNYPRTIDFSVFREIADEVGAYLMVDMAHPVGLIIAGIHPSPIPYADVVTTSTHKTFRGPRLGGLILCRKEYSENIDAAVSPGLQSAPMMDIIASRAVLFKEAMHPQFRAYQQQTVKNAKILAESLNAQRFKLLSDGTDTHLMVINLRDKGITGDEASLALESVGIIVSKTHVPFDNAESPRPGGIRIGSPAVTTRGMKGREMKHIATILGAVLRNPHNKKIRQEARKEVKTIAKRFTLFSKEWQTEEDQPH